MANELMYAQFLDRAGDMTGTSVTDQIAAENAYEKSMNQQNLAQAGVADFTPGEFNADQMLEDAGWGGYGPMDVAVGAAMKPMMATMLNSTLQGSGKGVTAIKNKLLGKSSEKILKKATGKTLGKTALKLGGKAASRAIPGIGWALGAADLIDYFGFPIYDYVPGGDYLTWRDTD